MLEQEKYRPLILQKLQDYVENFDEEEHAEFIDYYAEAQEEDNLYKGAMLMINLLKSFIK